MTLTQPPIGAVVRVSRGITALQRSSACAFAVVADFDFALAFACAFGFGLPLDTFLRSRPCNHLLEGWVLKKIFRL